MRNICVLKKCSCRVLYQQPIFKPNASQTKFTSSSHCVLTKADSRISADADKRHWVSEGSAIHKYQKANPCPVRSSVELHGSFVSSYDCVWVVRFWIWVDECKGWKQANRSPKYTGDLCLNIHSMCVSQGPQDEKSNSSCASPSRTQFGLPVTDTLLFYCLKGVASPTLRPACSVTNWS